ncbi:MAG: polyhydroxyalkanoic acid system family protein [Bdellovibrionales bacterium]|nr:polyhydroxyalkanoic acid system family protein [Bdellovibrionales bacterium]
MPKINIDKSSKHSLDETYARIKKVMADDPDLKKLDSSYQCEFDDSQKTIDAKGKTFKAQVKIDGADSDAKVSVVVDLPLMFMPFKGVVETTLSKKLEKALV